MNLIHIYTDGSCEPNPGHGGWAAIILYDGDEKVLSGSEQNSTNNRMELTAALKALSKINTGENVQVHTDSQYLQKGVQEWLPNWKARGWRRKGGSLANSDLWQELDEELGRLHVTWKWIKGHAGNPYNEMVDKLAQQEIRRKSR